MSSPPSSPSQPTAGPTTPSAAIDAWQSAVAAEYAAAYGYGELGPKLTDSAQLALARTGEQAHRDNGAASAQLLVARGVPPAEPQADYPLPFAITDAGAARQLALRLEAACASAWRYVVSVDSAPADVRALAVGMLTDSAVRAVRWRALITPATPTTPFPGI